MFGGPFHSAGVARIINGEVYRYYFVSYAHWVNLSHNYNHVVIKKGGRTVAKVPESELEATFARLDAGKPAVPTLREAKTAAEARAIVGATERGIRNLAGISVLPAAAGHAGARKKTPLPEGALVGPAVASGADPGDEEDEGDDGLDDTRV